MRANALYTPVVAVTLLAATCLAAPHAEPFWGFNDRTSTKHGIFRRDMPPKTCNAKQQEHIEKVLSDTTDILNAAISMKNTDPSWKTFFDPTSKDAKLHERVISRFETMQRLTSNEGRSVSLSCAVDEEECYATETYTLPPYDTIYLCPSFFEEPVLHFDDPFLGCQRLQEDAEVPFMMKSAYLIHEMAFTLNSGDDHIDDCVYGPYWSHLAATQAGNTEAAEYNADNYVSAAVAKFFNEKCQSDTAYGSQVDNSDKMTVDLLPMVQMPTRLDVPKKCLWENKPNVVL